MVAEQTAVPAEAVEQGPLLGADNAANNIPTTTAAGAAALFAGETKFDPDGKRSADSRKANSKVSSKANKLNSKKNAAPAPAPSATPAAKAVPTEGAEVAPEAPAEGTTGGRRTEKT